MLLFHIYHCLPGVQLSGSIIAQTIGTHLLCSLGFNLKNDKIQIGAFNLNIIICIIIIILDISPGSPPPSDKCHRCDQCRSLAKPLT